MNNYIPASSGGYYHSFDAKLATRLKSLEMAAMAFHFQYWIKHNAVLGKNFHEGRTWSYQTIKEISAHFPYWSEKQVRLIIDKLVKAKILLRGNFNINAYDRTAWYSFEDEAYFEILRDICPNGQMVLPEQANGFAQKGTPIPHNIPYREKKKKKKDLPKIEFDYDLSEFVNITEADKTHWSSLYPGVNISRELVKMRDWLLDPEKEERDGNKAFITGWLERAYNKLPKTKKPIPEPVKPLESTSVIPYHSAVAASYRDKSEEEYIDYLKSVSDQSHYQNYLQTKGKQ